MPHREASMVSSFGGALVIASLAACGETHAAAVGEAARIAAPVSAAPPEIVAAPAAPAGAPPNGCPQAMARIDAFCIDRYEAHLVRRGASGELAPHPYFERPEEGVTYEARSEPGVFPQAYVSRVESEAACANAGKRLCSRTEWQRACMGPRGTVFPYGDLRQPRRCNTDKPHLLTIRFGADTLRWRYEDFNDPALAREPGFLAKTGEHAGCVGDEGLHDLVGNLHEWVSDTADAALMARLAADGVARSFQYHSPGNGVFMGGFFSTRSELGPGCTFTTVAHDPAYHDYSTGFRCCVSAAPSDPRSERRPESSPAKP